MRALRPDISDWSVDTELLAVIAENISGMRVIRPGRPVTAPVLQEVPQDEPEGEGAMAQKMRDFFGTAVRYVAPADAAG